jgi:hypothetical protein
VEIRNDTIITHPRELVYHTYRDRLPELVEMLDNIESMTELDRREEGDTIHLLNEWKAQGEIPKIAQKWIKPEMLRWKDHATWHAKEWTVDWRFEMAFLTDRVHVAGKSYYLERGPSRTELQLRGDLTIDAMGMPGMPRLIARKAGPVVERFVLALVQPNLVKTAHALQRFLDEGR